MILGIILVTVMLMCFTLTSLNKIMTITNEHQNTNTPEMITSMALQKDIIQIQQWLTDISATRAKPGFDDGFDEAEKYYKSAVSKINILKQLGIEAALTDSLLINLDEYYKIGIEMAHAYINNGTDAGNVLMEKFDPYAASMEESVGQLLARADANFSNGNKNIILSINKLYKKTIILFSLVILISVLVYLFIQGLVIRRLKEMRDILKDISEGDGDLTKRVAIESKDEIGTMALYFNNFADIVNNIVLSVKELANQITEISEELTATAQQSAATAEEAAQSINEIAKGALDQAQSTTEGSEKLMILGSHIEENNCHINILKETSSRADEIAGQGLKIVDKLATRTKEVRNVTDSVHGSIMKTDENAAKISEASSLITSIADKTNLLALNAAIEAARAGEHGKGFAVVAEEIRKLAEQSTDSTKIIDDIVKNLQQDATKAVKTMDEVAKTLKVQVENVDLAEGKYREIAESINQSREAVETIAEAGRQMAQKKDEAINTIQTLSAVAEENSAGTEQASASIQEQASSIERIAQASTGLTQMFSELERLIEQFKV